MNWKRFAEILGAFLFVFVVGFVVGQWRLQASSDVLVVYTRNAGYTVSWGPDCQGQYLTEEFQWIEGDFKCVK